MLERIDFISQRREVLLFCRTANKIAVKTLYCEKYFTNPAFQNIIEPSDPPLANRASWIGCQAMAKT
jgi:hypothetical protein